MAAHLVLKLQGAMQAWGTHTYEDYRPSQPFPSLSGIIGLLGACLGIQRHERDRLIALADSIQVVVRADDRGSPRPAVVTDFHTVLDARKVGGGVNPYPVVSRREYLCDASFTLVLAQRPEPAFFLEEIANAVKRPVYTPFLGRRSCPLSRPLFECWSEATDPVAVLREIRPGAGVVYGLDPAHGESRRLVRDVPLPGHRQFGTREVGGLVMGRDDHVPE